MKQYIDKTAVVAEIEKIKSYIGSDKYLSDFEKGCNFGREDVCDSLLNFLNTLEVKEMDIASMADEYYNALIKEADWMDEGTMGHCRLAYYTGCKDVLNKIQKGE